MPWAHCDVQYILDDETCPTCKITKAAWTVEIDKTRTLVIGRKKKGEPEAWIEVALADPEGEPVAEHPYHVSLGDGRVVKGSLDARGVARIGRLFPGLCQVRFPGLLVSLSHPAGKIELTKEQCRASGGERYEFQALPKGVKVDLALKLRFDSLSRARSFLLRNRMEVRVDGERIPCGVLLDDPERVVVQFRVPPGQHTVLISSREADAPGKSKPKRIVYLSQSITVSEPSGAKGDVTATQNPTLERGRSGTRIRPHGFATFGSEHP